MLDSNGNKMASNGQTINFTQENDNTVIEDLTTGSVIARNGNYKVVLASDITQTDSNGQVRMILLGGGMSCIRNLKANCPGYSVRLEIQKKKYYYFIPTFLKLKDFSI